MAQVAIREYDAKLMFFESIWQKYNWIQVKSKTDLEKLEEWKKYVIKPDMLFWKRWKLWLLWIKLTKEEIIEWYDKYNKKEMKITGVLWILEVFLVEEFVEHNEEYYISFEANRDFDILNFSYEWGIEVEENWKKVKTIEIETGKDINEEQIEKLFINCNTCAWNKNNTSLINKEKIISTIKKLYNFYKNYWLVYLEVNPFCFDKNWNIILLDMVWKIDDQEYFLQKNHWKNLEIPNTFGFKQNNREKYIRELDSQTGASLKFKVLNKNAKIWTLLAWWGGSLVITDSLWSLWFANEIWNYGELSWNPSRDFTREYTRELLEQMLENEKKWKYLIIAGAIANFTDIATTFAWIIDIFEEKKEEILKQKIQVLVRRWWINEKKWLEIMKNSCKKIWITCKVADSSEYMTDILKEIK